MAKIDPPARGYGDEMRAFRPGLALVVAMAACAPQTAEPTTTDTVTPTPSTTHLATTSVPTTMPESNEVVLVIDDAELVAVDRGIQLQVSDEKGAVLGRLDREHPRLRVDPSTDEVLIRYLTAEGLSTDVAWSQDLDRPVIPVRQAWRDRDECAVLLPDGSTAPVAIVWQSGGDTATYRQELDELGAVTVVSPVWWRLTDDGSLTSGTDPEYVDAVHERNVAIWPAVAEFDADTIHLVMSDPGRASQLAAAISEQASRIGADGVNIDIEGYRAEDSAAFVTWVDGLARLVHDWGGVVSHDVVPRSDTWDVRPEPLSFWSTAPARSELSSMTDCTVLMAYDQHNGHRPAGPVASPPWVEDVLVHELRHADPSELVLGVPFYGRVWDPSALHDPSAIAIGAVDELVEEGEVSFDNEHGLNRVDLPDGRFLWAETTDHLRHRFDLVADYGLAGWAAWRSGFAHPGIWELVESK